VPTFVYDIPQTDLAIWFAILAVLVAFAGVVLVKPFLRLLIGREPGINDSVGHASAGVGLLYGLLVGLLAVAAYQNRERVQETVLREAAAVGSLYADMNSYPEPIRSEVKEMLRDYVQYTIHKDWPAHRRGEVMAGGAHRADAMRQRLALFAPATVSQEIVHREVIRAFQDFSNFRQQRLTGVSTRIPEVLWYAVAVGAAVNIVLILMLRIRAIPHFVLTAVNAFFLGVILFVIVALDDPLRGERGLPPTAFELLWERQMVWDEPQV
jgi:hypothetical protein